MVVLVEPLRLFHPTRINYNTIEARINVGWNKRSGSTYEESIYNHIYKVKTNKRCQIIGYLFNCFWRNFDHLFAP